MALDVDRLNRLLIHVGWATLAVSVAAYPASALTVARDEPGVVLFLSFLAI